LPPSPELDNLRVVLVSTRNPLNLGAAARAMSNFGFMNLRVVNPYAIAFREARSAVGASSVLKKAQEYQELREAIDDCALVVGTTTLRNRQRQQPLYRLEEGVGRIRRKLRSERVALLFGSEKVGLSNEDLSHCQWLMHIPTREMHPSMNLGQAVAVCLYEMIRSGKLPRRTAETKSASTGQLERVTDLLHEALQASGYLGVTPPATSVSKIRRLVRRLNFDAADSELLLGMLRQILWKIRSQE
jgi:TrmH family RNA methyltransferase